MKKLLFVLLAMLPILCFSQNSIVTTSGDTITGKISSFLGKKIIFNKEIKSLGSNSIPINNVVSISGYLPDYRINAISKANPAIIYKPNGIIQGGNISPERVGVHINSINSAGDLIKESAALRLTGYGIGIAATSLSAAGLFKDLDQETHKTIMIISGVTSLCLVIAGEITLIKAGNKMNSDAVRLGMADNGVGIAIKF